MESYSLVRYNLPSNTYMLRTGVLTDGDVLFHLLTTVVDTCRTLRWCSGKLCFDTVVSWSHASGCSVK